jgi:hypothetical protein
MEVAVILGISKVWSSSSEQPGLLPSSEVPFEDLLVDGMP